MAVPGGDGHKAGWRGGQRGAQQPHEGRRFGLRTSRRQLRANVSRGEGRGRATPATRWRDRRGGNPMSSGNRRDGVVGGRGAARGERHSDFRGRTTTSPAGNEAHRRDQAAAEPTPALHPGRLADHQPSVCSPRTTVAQGAMKKPSQSSEDAGEPGEIATEKFEWGRERTLRAGTSERHSSGRCRSRQRD
jgi:hypothetical protein